MIALTSHRRAALASLVAGFLLVLAGQSWSQPERPDNAPLVDIVEVRGLIDDPVADHVFDRIAAAEDEGVDALVLQMDSPGALDVDIDRLVHALRTTPVPVVAWVAPRGARAEGAAAQIANATDGIFLATDAYVERSADAGAKEDSPGGGAFPAIGPPEPRASSLGDLLQAMDGQRFDRSLPLETWDAETNLPSATLRFQDMGPLAQLLHVVTAPRVALFLLLIGAFGLIFEAYNPGIGLAAIIAVASLALALYGLDALPTNWPAILLILAGIVALVYDVHVAGFGPPTVGGLLAVGAGAKLSFPAAPDAVSLDWWVAAAAVVTTLVFFVSVMTAALRVRLRRPVTGDDAVIGAIAEAQTDIAPEGTVITKGTVWRARTMETGIAAGEKVKVMASEGFVLLVEPLHEHPSETR